MFLEQQLFWVSLVNSRDGWPDAKAFFETIPEADRDFSDPPGWSRKKAFTYLVNNVDLLRANHRALEEGRRLEYDMLNHVLSEGVLRLVDPKVLETGRSRRGAGSRIETLVAVSRNDGLNAGTVFVRDTVGRAAYFFSQYVDYRLGDPAYPRASVDRFQVRECLRADCSMLFTRTPERPLYCRDECARLDR